MKYDILLELGFSKDKIKTMVDENPDIENVSTDDLQKKVNFLRGLNIKETEIVEVIYQNPQYLTNSDDNLVKVIILLKEIGCKNIHWIIIGNSDILNLHVFELKTVIKNMIESGVEDITETLEENPMLINEYH